MMIGTVTIPAAKRAPVIGEPGRALMVLKVFVMATAETLSSLLKRSAMSACLAGTSIWETLCRRKRKARAP